MLTLAKIKEIGDSFPKTPSSVEHYFFVDEPVASALGLTEGELVCDGTVQVKIIRKKPKKGLTIL